MKTYFLSLLLTCLTSFSFSQIHEIGVFVGGSNYIGDIGSTHYIKPNNIGGGVIYKYNLNPRIALRGTMTYLPITGNDTNASSTFRQQRGNSFSNSIFEIAAGTEFNFFDYNIQEHNTSFTPYILAEVAVFSYKNIDAVLTNGSNSFKNNFSYAIPVGIGIKGRLAYNMAYAFETGVRFTFVDDLDYTTPEFSQLNFGGYGNDYYVFTGLSIVYTFGRPPCYAPRD